MSSSSIRYGVGVSAEWRIQPPTPCRAVSNTRPFLVHSNMRSSKPHVEARPAGYRTGRRADVDPTRLRIAGNQRTGADHVVGGDFHVIVEGAVHADEAALADLAVTRNDRMRGDEHVVVHDRAMSHVIAAPQ